MGNGILTASVIVGTIAAGVTAALLSDDKYSGKKTVENTVRNNFTPAEINNSGETMPPLPTTRILSLM